MIQNLFTPGGSRESGLNGEGSPYGKTGDGDQEKGLFGLLMRSMEGETDEKSALSFFAKGEGDNLFSTESGDENESPKEDGRQLLLGLGTAKANGFAQRIEVKSGEGEQISLRDLVFAESKLIASESSDDSEQLIADSENAFEEDEEGSQNVAETQTSQSDSKQPENVLSEENKKSDRETREGDEGTEDISSTTAEGEREDVDLKAENAVLNRDGAAEKVGKADPVSMGTERTIAGSEEEEADEISKSELNRVEATLKEAPSEDSDGLGENSNKSTRVTNGDVSESSSRTGAPAAERLTPFRTASTQRSEIVPEGRIQQNADQSTGRQENGTLLSGEDDSELTEEQRKLFNSVQSGARSAEATEKGVDLRNLKAREMREKRSESARFPFAQRADVSAGRGELFTSGRIDTMSKPVIEASGMDATKDPDLSEEEILWKEHTAEGSDPKESRAFESQQGQIRLSQIPVSNLTLRRAVMPGLTQAVQKMAGSQSSPETWQKHNFVLDDGNKVQLSAREMDGVLQLKLGSSSSELNRLLLQHQHEIRDHLEKECGLSIDLQFDSQNEGAASGFFGSNSSGGNGDQPIPNGKASPLQDETAEEVVKKTVRKFGYNQNEWTA